MLTALRPRRSSPTAPLGRAARLAIKRLPTRCEPGSTPSVGHGGSGRSSSIRGSTPLPSATRSRCSRAAGLGTRPEMGTRGRAFGKRCRRAGSRARTSRGRIRWPGPSAPFGPARPTAPTFYRDASTCSGSVLLPTVEALFGSAKSSPILRAPDLVGRAGSPQGRGPSRGWVRGRDRAWGGDNGRIWPVFARWSCMVFQARSGRASFGAASKTSSGSERLARSLEA